MTLPGTTATVGIAATTRTTVIRPLVVDPHTGETPEEQELARATQRFLDTLAARAQPGVETAEGYNPPEASDDGSGPHSSDGADGEEPPRFIAFGVDREGW